MTDDSEQEEKYLYTSFRFLASSFLLLHLLEIIFLFLLGNVSNNKVIDNERWTSQNI